MKFGFSLPPHLTKLMLLNVNVIRRAIEEGKFGLDFEFPFLSHLLDPFWTSSSSFILNALRVSEWDPLLHPKLPLCSSRRVDAPCHLSRGMTGGGRGGIVASALSPAPWATDCLLAIYCPVFFMTKSRGCPFFNEWMLGRGLTFLDLNFTGAVF